MMKSATLRFSIGCSILLFAAILQLFFPGFLTLILILFAVGFCIRQWYRRTRDLKKQITQEQTIRLAADQYINARFK
jgi:UPF0716 family protein affecting phage T7 exclusion